MEHGGASKSATEEQPLTKVRVDGGFQAETDEWWEITDFR
eukprot:CAMPEP_0194528622 /NCGR_PEP_ID=MMETSP0253-20130528/65065_1 /TAXON_ID=2966 /ORGANISM="Noctiluca scintillans" /LENGTH=39 /DNA_ID= /DNA_START= /DNA_END= /DNA_ORIENTATION=